MFRTASPPRLLKSIFFWYSRRRLRYSRYSLGCPLNNGTIGVAQVEVFVARICCLRRWWHSKGSAKTERALMSGQSGTRQCVLDVGLMQGLYEEVRKERPGAEAPLPMRRTRRQTKSVSSKETSDAKPNTTRRFDRMRFPPS